MQLIAPAKINLLLQIHNLRPDGFHEIETLLTPISLHDEIIVTANPASSGIDFQCDDPSLPTNSSNLAVRAAELFFVTTGQKADVTIQLRKGIPHGAGLGGGSSDAGNILLGLNQFYQTGLNLPQLAGLAAQIGSDVPFFLFKSAAICRGRGEAVTPVKLSSPLSLLLIKPAFGVATAWAYSHWKKAKEIPGVTYDPQKFADVSFVNHLERPVFEKFVFLAQIKMWLRNQTEVGAALLSGSGSTVFGVIKNAKDADTLAARVKHEIDPELWTCQCETC